MKIGGVASRSIWLELDGWSVGIFDQRLLPGTIERLVLREMTDAAVAIKEMATRGAPMIGAVGAYGLALHMRHDASDAGILSAYATLLETRPTAVNLRLALDRVRDRILPLAQDLRVLAAYEEAARICEEDVRMNRAIGEAGLALIQDVAARKGGAAVNILTHCNAGWLATVDLGTVTAPVYLAHDAGIKLHVWVSETRPRNQGALTAFELAEQGVPHSYVVDNAAGLLLQRGEVDLVIVGTDRVTANGDVCNKIGTYLKALAARAHDIAFLVALPSSSYDAHTPKGVEVPIEERSAQEVSHVVGLDASGQRRSVQVTQSAARNPSFDITPAALVSGYITEHGILRSAEDLARAMA